MSLFFGPKHSKEWLEEKERRIVELEELEREKKERRIERREEEEYLRAEREYEKKERKAQRQDDLWAGLEERENRRSWRNEDYDSPVLPPKDYPEQGPQWSGPSLGKWNPQWGDPSPADYRKFCLLIFIILSLGLLVGFCSFVPTIIWFLWGQ